LAAAGAALLTLIAEPFFEALHDFVQVMMTQLALKRSVEHHDLCWTVGKYCAVCAGTSTQIA
jgi:hypothetical protein